jgi:molybdopterin converting factor small subunit
MMMNQVEVEVLPWLSRALGKENKVKLTEIVEKGETLKTLLERIAFSYEGFGAAIYDAKGSILRENVVVFINDRSLQGGLHTNIHAGDRVIIAPIYSGG